MAEEQKFDARLAEGVAYFEQMLQLMPEDRVTLEFLVVAYEQLGRRADSQKALVALARILIKEHDTAALEGLLPRLEACDAAEAKALALKARTLVAPAPDLTPEAPPEMTEGERADAISASAEQAELALVDELEEGGALSEADAAAVREQLGATHAPGRVFLISALQILEKENPPALERCMAFIADRHGAPPVPLAAFDTPRELAAKFPPLLMRIRGVVPFASIGGETLVAVLDPADEALCAELSSAAKCRIYMAAPSAVEAALGRLFEGEEGVT